MASHEMLGSKEIYGVELINMTEQSMGKTGLEVLGTLARKFLFSVGDEVPPEEIIKRVLTLQLEMKEIIVGLKQWTFMICKMPDDSVLDVSFARFTKETSISWTAKKYVRDQSGSGGLWNLQANYVTTIDLTL